MEQHIGADAFIEVLNANGVENVFFNPGGEQAAILATVAKYRVAGKKCPRLVLCLDEAVAMTAAYGHYVASGQPQAVMVHAELGTLQIGGAWHNAQWGRIPVVVLAGMWGTPQRTTWENKPYDQGGIVRNNVRWDHDIAAGEDLYEALGEAFRKAYSEPRGPVYVTYSGGMMAREIKKKTVVPTAIDAEPSAPPVDEVTIGEVAKALIAAKNPLIVVGYTGRHPETIPALVELAETLGTPVLTSQVWMNFPTTHPLCAGIEQILGSRKPNTPLAEADTLLVIDYDIAYAVAAGLPGKDAKIIHFDVDPMTQGKPLWGRGADLFVKADSRQAIPALTETIRSMMTPAQKAALAQRAESLGNKHATERAGWRAAAVKEMDTFPISSDWLSRCIADLIDEDTIVVNHNISMSASPLEQIDITKPRKLLGCAAGSIQWAPGAALGAKIAHPESTVVSLMTDGGFVWGSPVATLWTAKAYRAPFLAVIFNNEAYGYMRNLVHRTSGLETFTDDMAFEAGVDIKEPPDFAGVAESCGAFGRKVTRPEEILPALKEALKQVRNGRAAVVDVAMDKEHDWL
jgi:acetolactate synthase-1/2/3 large subunit